jgi:flagellar protein FlaG
MTVEPISSAMAYQAQGTAKTQETAPVNTDVPEEAQNTNNIDATTAAVTQTQAEDDKQDDGSKQQSGSQNAQKQVVSDPLKKAIAEMNKKINNSNEEAVFGVHEETNRVMIKIVDKDTKEVVKEFPPEKTLDMIAKVWEVAGILVDEKR